MNKYEVRIVYDQVLYTTVLAESESEAEGKALSEIEFRICPDVDITFTEKIEEPKNILEACEENLESILMPGQLSLLEDSSHE